MLGTEPPPVTPVQRRFDVFLSYSSADKRAVEKIAEKLARAGLDPWFDKWCLTPGGRWQEELADGLGASRACAVFIGPDDLGDWEREELAVALDRAAKDRSFRVFLVLLPGLPEPFEPGGLSPFLSMRTWVDFRRGVDDTRALQGIVKAIQGIPLGPEIPIEPGEDVPPYRGLQAFDEEHADLFFGRDADVQRLVEKLKASPFLAILGPSGSGKSSLARAGLIPVLKRGAVPGSDEWRIVTLRPGSHPLDALTGHLHALYPDLTATRIRDQLAGDPRTLRLLTSRPPAGGTKAVLLVDQFEEVFTLCRDEQERRGFIENILHAATADGPSAVIVTMRADFYPRCAAYPELAQQLAGHQFLVGAMGSDALRQAIEEPARRVGLELESGLVDTILEDVERQPGALPLLEHALLELWERRRGGLLTLEAYQETGGVTGALAKRADGILATFDPHEREIVRRVLLRLTQPGEGAEDTRRRAQMSELITARADTGAVEHVVAALADARLLTTGRDQVEVSHEALIRSWPQLRRWVEEDRQGLRIHRRLTEAAEEWRALNREPGALYRGARLGAAREWAQDHDADLNDLEREFLGASQAAEVAELEAAKRRARRSRAFAVALGLLLVATVIAAVFAVRAADEAEEQGEIASSGALAGQSVAQLDRRLDLALLLSLQAHQAHPSPEARNALMRALQRSDGLAAVRRPTGENAIAGMALSPDDRTVAINGGDARVWRISLWDLETGKQLGKPLTGHTDDVIRLVFSPDGRMLASSSDDHTVRLWEVPSGRPIETFEDASSGIAFSPDGERLALADFGTGIRILDAATRQVLARSRSRDALRSDLEAEALAFSPDGRTLVSGNQLAPLQFWTQAGDRLVPARGCAELPLRESAAVDATYTRDGRTVLLTSYQGRVAAADVARCRIVAFLPGAAPVALSPDGERLAVGGAGGRVRFLDPHTLRRRSEPVGNFDRVGALAFMRDGRRLVSTERSSGVISVLDLAGAHTLGNRMTAELDYVWAFAVGPDGRTAAAAHGDRAEVVLWDVQDDRRLPGPPAGIRGESLAFSPDGSKLAIAGSEALVLWDLRAQRRLAQQGLRSDRESLTSVAFSADGQTLATTGTGGRVRLWDVDGLRPIGAPIGELTENTANVAFSPDGTLVVCDFDNGALVHVDPATRKQVGDRMSGCASSLAVSPDGRTLAAGGYSVVTLWDLRTHKMLGEPLSGQQGEIASVSFSPDGRTLASTESGSTAGGNVFLWDVESRRQIGDPIPGYTHAAFSRTGTGFITAGETGVARWDPLLWTEDERLLRDRICGMAGQGLTAAEREEFLPEGADGPC